MSRRRLSLAIGALCLVTLVTLGRSQLHELGRLAQVSPVAVAGILLLYVTARGLNGEIMRAALRRLGHEIGRYEAFVLTILVSYTNLLIPRAGLGAPALYLKHRHRIDYAVIGSLLLVTAVLQGGAIGVAGLAVQGLLAAGGESRASPAVAALFAAVTAAAAAAAFARFPVPDAWRSRLAGFARRLNQAWRKLGASRAWVGRILLVQGAILLLRALRLQLAFWAIGQPVGFAGVMVASLLADLMFFVSLTPAALGFREGAIAYGASLMGVEPAIGVSAAVLDRLVWTAGVALLGQLFLWRHVPGRAARGVAEAAPASDPGDGERLP